MEAISKSQVIGLMDKIQRDGLSNDKYAINTFFMPTNPAEFYGCYPCKEVPDLQPGSYFALWFGDEDLSDMPNVREWYYSNLNRKNCEQLVIKDFEGYVCVIRLN